MWYGNSCASKNLQISSWLSPTKPEKILDLICGAQLEILEESYKMTAKIQQLLARS